MSEPTRFSLSDGMDLAGLDLDNLWWRYFALGGNADAATLAGWLFESRPCERHEHDLIAQALNEAFLDRGEGTFPVGYTTGSPLGRPVAETEQTVEMSRSSQARRYAAVARLRSAAAARQSMELHATAARLMQASGQLQFARRAEFRARAAQQRAVVSSAA